VTPDTTTMLETRDYLVDVDELENGSDTASTPAAGADRVAMSMKERPTIAVYWLCCNLFGHMYRNRKRTAFTGSCPGCSKSVRAKIGVGGTRSKSFKIC